MRQARNPLNSFGIILSLIIMVLPLDSCRRFVQCTSCSGEGTVICRNCNGDKKYETSEDCRFCRNGRVHCDQCEGEGQIECQYCEGSRMRLQPCFVCGGSGDDDSFSGFPCGLCGGAGMSMQQCFECQGNGYEQCQECYGNGYERCGECEGSGSVSEEHDCRVCNEEGKVQCRKCLGEGEIEDS